MKWKLGVYRRNFRRSDSRAELEERVGETGARRRLEAVLAEQARLSTAYNRAIGTGREQTAYFRLRDVNARVAKFDRVARQLGKASR